MTEKYRLLMISDMPLFPSGVGLQARFIINKLVKTGKFKILSLGAALKHPNYAPIKTEEWKDDVIIFPIDGYGNKELLRQIIDVEKPDALWFMTDPRFYRELFAISEEIQQRCPLIYNHLWDALPYPKYNEFYYKTIDKIVCINKLTYKMLKDNGFEDKIEYLPHGVPEDKFTILPKEKIIEIKKSHIEDGEDKFIIFYNSRNALRKRTGTVIWAYKEFREMLPEEERDKVFMCMKTPTKDPEGQDLHRLVDHLGLKGTIGFAEAKVEDEIMNEFYNMSDMTISLSSEEGFGLSILESLMTGTPVICTKTGGMQDQVIDSDTGDEFGFCLEPDARSLVGSQLTPYIFSDHLNTTKVAKHIKKIYDRWKEHGDHKEYFAGQKARASMLKRFNLKHIQNRWAEIIEEEILKYREKKNQSKQVRMAVL